MKRWKRMIRRTALALFAVAVVIPVQASARPYDDDRSPIVSPSQAASTARWATDPQVLRRHQALAKLTSVAPASISTPAHLQELQALNGRYQAQTGITHQAVSPDNRAGSRGADPGSTVGVTGSSGFDWGDAGIGALGTLAAALVLAGLMLVAVHSRRQGKVAY